MMTNYTKLIDAIAEQTDGQFRNASAADLEKLRDLGAPDSVVAFFAKHEPAECVEGQVRLWPIATILRENRDFVPGCYISKHGYIVFSTTIYGDVYCFDTTEINKDGEPRIVIVSHEQDFEKMPVDQIKRHAKPIAENLTMFLEAFLQGELDEECY